MQYWSRFVLVGSMNPEEGNLRPQIMDRFGLRAVVRGLADPEQRYRAYEQSVAYHLNPDQMAANYAQETMYMADEIAGARERVARVIISERAKQVGLNLIQQMQIDSMRAEIALFEAAKAHAAADERKAVVPSDIGAVSLVALRLRKSERLQKFHRVRASEDDQLKELFSTCLQDQPEEIDEESAV
jgi:magnesium chelatase subunit I